MDPTIRCCRGFDDLCDFFRCENTATWLEDRTIAAALICFAMLFSCSGAIMFSLLAERLVCQVTAMGFASKIESARLKLDSDKEGPLFRGQVSSSRL